VNIFARAGGLSGPRLGKCVLVFLLALLVLVAPPQKLSAQTTPPVANTAQPPSYAQQTPEQLQQLVAPIALYPDSLVAQILAAATFPEQIVGYYYRIVTKQGKNALGGAKSYVVNGRMTEGFAFVAYPAEYRSSGVMTFVVDGDGVVYQKDLGKKTDVLAKAMTEYNPDSSWQKVEGERQAADDQKTSR
jgi:hypothetical protein